MKKISIHACDVMILVLMNFMYFETKKQQFNLVVLMIYKNKNIQLLPRFSIQSQVIKNINKKGMIFAKLL